MPEFQLDTSGAVPMGRGENMGFAGINLRWSDLDAFTQGYIEAMFSGLAYQPPTEADSWSAHTDKVRAIAFSDLAPETLAHIIADCAALLSKLPGVRDSAERGRGFWNERQAGYLDKPPEPRFSPLTPYLGDDGKVYLREVA